MPQYSKTKGWITAALIFIAVIAGTDYFLKKRTSEFLNEFASTHSGLSFHNDYMEMINSYERRYLSRSLSEDSIDLILQSFDKDCKRMDSLELISSMAMTRDLIQDSAIVRASHAGTFRLMLKSFRFKVPELQFDTLILPK